MEFHSAVGKDAKARSNKKRADGSQYKWQRIGQHYSILSCSESRWWGLGTKSINNMELKSSQMFLQNKLCKNNFSKNSAGETVSCQQPTFSFATINNFCESKSTQLWLRLGAEKQNYYLHVDTSHKTVILVKPGHNWWPTTARSVCSLLFSEAVPNNYLLLQLQLRSAGSLHVAFRNLRESQIWGRVVVGHQRENQRTFSP